MSECTLLVFPSVLQPAVVTNISFFHEWDVKWHSPFTIGVHIGTKIVANFFPEMQLPGSEKLEGKPESLVEQLERW